LVAGFWHGRGRSIIPLALILSPPSGAFSNPKDWDFSPQKQHSRRSPERPTSSPPPVILRPRHQKILMPPFKLENSTSPSARCPPLPRCRRPQKARRRRPPVPPPPELDSPVSIHILSLSVPWIRILRPGLDDFSELVPAT
jgi:hypothetical protein